MDHQELEAFYRAEIDGAMRLAVGLTSGGEAHDIVQDAFVGLLRAWDRTANPQAYLRRSIVNGARNTFRRRDSQRAKVTALRAQPRSDTPDDPDELGDLIAALPDKQRAVVVLRFQLQMQDHEIADALGIRRGSVGPTLTRAIRTLRKELDHGV